VKQQWDDFRLAGAFLTVLPVARGVATDPARLARSMGLFPAVGLVLGLALVLVDHALGLLLPRSVLDCLLILLLIAVTGGLHLDGVADLTDGLAGGRDREGALRIMKDSRVGAMGAVALVMVLLLKYLSLVNIPPGMKPAALLLMPAAGRWVQVVLAACCPYARPEGGTGAAFVDRVGHRESLIATATLLLAAAVLFRLQAVIVVAALALAAIALSRYFRARLGGVTGDVLGAATELVEVFVLLVLLALHPVAEGGVG
jgi:adenosylcobinamide-GDP ribazoletransferase